MKEADRASPALPRPAFQCRDGVAKKGANKKQASTDIIQRHRKEEAESRGTEKTRLITLDRAIRVTMRKYYLSRFPNRLKE